MLSVRHKQGDATDTAHADRARACSAPSRSLALPSPNRHSASHAQRTYNITFVETGAYVDSECVPLAHGGVCALTDGRGPRSPVLSGFRSFTSDRTRLRAIFPPYNIDIVHLLSHESFGSTVRGARGCSPRVRSSCVNAGRGGLRGCRVRRLRSGADDGHLRALRDRPDHGTRGAPSPCSAGLSASPRDRSATTLACSTTARPAARTTTRPARVGAR